MSENLSIIVQGQTKYKAHCFRDVDGLNKLLASLLIIADWTGLLIIADWAGFCPVTTQEFHYGLKGWKEKVFHWRYWGIMMSEWVNSCSPGILMCVVNETCDYINELGVVFFTLDCLGILKYRKGYPYCFPSTNFVNFLGVFVLWWCELGFF